MYILLFQFFLFLAIGITFYKFYSKTAKDGDDIGSIYFERGGGWVGTNSLLTWQMTWPFVTIRLYNDFILLNYGGKEVKLDYSEITKVDLLYIPIIAEGVRIYHNNIDKPSHLRFWSFGHSKEIKALIEERMNKPGS